jgi:CheY-like chemotaxis protein
MKQIDQMNFLVVDDIPAMCQITANQLRALGASDICTVSNGADALRQLELKKFDCVLTDWNMPVMDGLTLLRNIRADPNLAHIPVLMVTADAERERIAQAIAAGVSDLLVKPYTSQRLMDKVMGALGARRRLPAMPVPKPPIPAGGASRPAAARQKATLLVVDDTPDNVRLVADLFADEYRVRVAHSGEKALAVCQSDSPPDLVLLDVMMPGMDGFEVATRMRAHPGSAHIPVIFVTALTDAASRSRGLHLGAVDFVTKPIDPGMLRLRVHNFMRHIAIHLERQAEYDDLLAAARLREEVEAMLRHDVKAPLAGLVGLARELACDAAVSPAHIAKVQMIEQAAMQALNTVRLSSALLNVENGNFRLSPEPVALAPLLQQVSAVARAAQGEKRVAVAVAADDGAQPLCASGEVALCQAIFQNLLNNACEAAPEDGTVTVTVWDEAPLRIVIENAGVVPAAIRERFFERNVTAGKAGGSGIGTYSARLLTEAQGGSIALACDDARNRTTLTVQLPRWQAA